MNKYRSQYLVVSTTGWTLMIIVRSGSCPVLNQLVNCPTYHWLPCLYSQTLMNFSQVLPDISRGLLLGKSLQLGRMSSNPNAFSKLNSAQQVPLLILSHSSLVCKTTLWSRQETMGNPYRQRNGIASCSQVAVASRSGNRN